MHFFGDVAPASAPYTSPRVPHAVSPSAGPDAPVGDDWPALASSARTIVFPNNADACGHAREFVAVDARGLTPDAADDMQVMVSELVGNVVRYTDGPVTVRVERAHRKIRVEVGDTSDVRIAERPSAPPQGQTNGRGLIIVDALATAWGADYEVKGQGKFVWFELAC